MTAVAVVGFPKQHSMQMPQLKTLPVTKPMTMRMMPITWRPLTSLQVQVDLQHSFMMRTVFESVVCDQ